MFQTKEEFSPAPDHRGSQNLFIIIILVPKKIKSSSKIVLLTRNLQARPPTNLILEIDRKKVLDKSCVLFYLESEYAIKNERFY